MKLKGKHRSLALLLAVSVFLALAGCRVVQKQMSDPKSTVINSKAEDDSGYIKEAVAGLENVSSIAVWNEILYAVVNSRTLVSWKNGSMDTLYTTDGENWISNLDASETGIYLCEASFVYDEATDIGKTKVVIKQLNLTGQVLAHTSMEELNAAPSEEEQPSAFKIWNGLAYLLFPDTVMAINLTARKIAQAWDLAADRIYLGLVKDAEGIQILSGTAESTAMERLNPQTGQVEESVTLSQSFDVLWDAPDGFSAIGTNETGIYGIPVAGGEPQAILIWDKCRISISRLSGLVPLGESNFACADGGDVYRLLAVDPSEIQERQTVTLAILFPGGHGREIGA